MPNSGTCFSAIVFSRRIVERLFVKNFPISINSSAGQKGHKCPQGTVSERIFIYTENRVEKVLKFIKKIKSFFLTKINYHIVASTEALTPTLPGFKFKMIQSFIFHKIACFETFANIFHHLTFAEEYNWHS